MLVDIIRDKVDDNQLSIEVQDKNDIFYYRFNGCKYAGDGPFFDDKKTGGLKNFNITITFGSF